MRNYLLWILGIVVVCGRVSALPLNAGQDSWLSTTETDASHHSEAQVISLKVTSSVAVNRKLRKYRIRSRKKLAHHSGVDNIMRTQEHPPVPQSGHVAASEVIERTELPPELAGANIEFIKQLNAKKEAKNFTSELHPFYLNFKKNSPNDTNHSASDEFNKVISGEPQVNYDAINRYSEDVPLARSVPFSPSPNNYIHNPEANIYNEGKDSPRVTTAVSFNIVHDFRKSTLNEASSTITETIQSTIPPQPLPFFQEPSKIYSQPAKIYSEPAKIYSEPAKIYSEPAKIYSEPAKVYGEPAKIYSVPAKFYSKPASLNLEPEVPIAVPSSSTESPSTTASVETTESPLVLEVINNTFVQSHEENEKNYEVDENANVETEGAIHGIQENPDDCKQDNCKVGYVVEGRQYRKYRVEERTSDGYIVGEYGVVRNEDGALRGVRYTADSEASPRLIYDALMKFLQLR